MKHVKKRSLLIVIVCILVSSVSSELDLKAFVDKTYHKCSCDSARWTVMTKMNLGFGEKIAFTLLSSSLTLKNQGTPSEFMLIGKNPGFTVNQKFRLGETFEWKDNGKTENVKFSLTKESLIEEHTWSDYLHLVGTPTATVSYTFTKQELKVEIIWCYGEVSFHESWHQKSIKSTCKYKRSC